MTTPTIKNSHLTDDEIEALTSRLEQIENERRIAEDFCDRHIKLVLDHVFEHLTELDVEQCHILDHLEAMGYPNHGQLKWEASHT